MVTRENCTGGLLAGGLSSRMGEDKANLVVNGAPMINSVARAVQSVTNSVLISSPHEMHEAWGKRIPDQFAKKGPIGGIHALLRSITTDWLLVCPCDMPYVTEAFFWFLMKHTNAQSGGVVIDQGKLYPLCGIYAKDSLPTVEEALTAGDLKMMRLVERLQMQKIEIRSHFGSETDRILANFNTPEDIKRWSHGNNS